MLKRHFLQTEAWAKFQQALGREVFEESGPGWSFLGFIEQGKFSRRLYCPYGPVCENVKSLSDSIVRLTSLSKEQHVDFIRVEPCGNVSAKDMQKLGFKKAHDFQPADTLITDISGSHEEILATLSQTARRYARKATKAGVTYTASYDPEDVKYFLDTIHDVHNRTGMKPFSDDYYQTLAAALFPDKSAGLLLAWLDGKVIASILFLKTKDVFSYAYAGNLAQYRSASPAVGLGQFALLYAHDEGCKEFDWHGVAPENAPPNHAWMGFTQFKLSFGGKRVSTIGTWELPLNKPKHLLYSALLKLTGKS